LIRIGHLKTSLLGGAKAKTHYLFFQLFRAKKKRMSYLAYLGDKNSSRQPISKGSQKNTPDKFPANFHWKLPKAYTF
jgi:hypothetical protein